MSAVMRMKLSEWAKRNGISYKTAWRWIKLCARLYGRRSAKNKAKKDAGGDLV